MDLGALDEVPFQPYGSPYRRWIPPETRDPVLLHYPTRQSVGAFGAGCRRDGRFIQRREEYRFKAVSCWAFLQDWWNRSQKQVVVITDHARYHQARLPQNGRPGPPDPFRLACLPPYRPALNPIERVWKLTRRLCLHHRYFSTLEEVIKTVENKFAEWEYGNSTLRTLCAIT